MEAVAHGGLAALVGRCPARLVCAAPRGGESSGAAAPCGWARCQPRARAPCTCTCTCTAQVAFSLWVLGKLGAYFTVLGFIYTGARLRLPAAACRALLHARR